MEEGFFIRVHYGIRVNYKCTKPYFFSKVFNLARNLECLKFEVN